MVNNTSNLKRLCVKEKLQNEALSLDFKLFVITF